MSKKDKSFVKICASKWKKILVTNQHDPPVFIDM